MKIKSTSEITNPKIRAAIEVADREQNPKVKVDYFFAPKVETTPAKRIRQSSKEPTKLELRFRAEILNPEFVAGMIDGIKEQSLTFKLGNGVRYTPDFIAWSAENRMLCYEVKGPHAFDGALEKLKVAAALYPQITWWLYWIFDGEWQHQLVLA